jgi:Spy/CpxP family protein refolding chaperone
VSVNDGPTSIVCSFEKETDAMKRFRIRQLAPAVVLLFTLVATLASAQDGRPGHRKMGGFGIMRALSRLDLTESQKTEVRKIMDSRKATFESLRERIHTDKEALNEAAEAQNPDAAVVGAAFLKVRADREALRAEHLATMEQIRSILTPEQKEKLDTLRHERKERFRGRRGMRERGGFGS